jgi:UDP-N-acetylglucosamine 2-epimerase (non-hydrolysing)
MKALRVVNVVGARPNFIKIAPILAAMRANPAFEPRLVHTGQHYDREMAQVFFEQLGIPDPDVNLGVGAGGATWQTAEIMVRFEKSLADWRPDLVLVVGDVNSTFACALTANRLGVRVAHVEAGLRSFDRTMPEEINRILTDHLSDYLFVSEPAGLENLRNEGIPKDKVFYVGNVMIDTLLRFRARAAQSDVRARLGLDGQDYAVVTLHRPSSVDDRAAFARIFEALRQIQRRLPIIFPVHPRTRQRIQTFGLGADFAAAPDIHVIEPLGYTDFMRLMADARLVLSDSGGIQEETCILGVPCITLRENTERPVTLKSGYHVLTGTDTGKTVAYAEKYLSTSRPRPFEIELWDGKTAERICDNLLASTAAVVTKRAQQQ